MNTLRKLLQSSTFLTVFLLTLNTCLGADPAPQGAKVSRWEADIKKFEESDKESPPKKNHILFVGSSSIRLWKLDKHFPKQQYINRGFGGSVLKDSTEFAERLIFPHEPKSIVLYAGDNDIARGNSAKQVVADFQEFVKKVHAKLPRSRILFIAIKPSLKRWDKISIIREANKRIQELCQQNKLLTFIDIDTPMIGKEGKPRQELFLADGLHLNEDGYKLWSTIVKEALAEK